MKKVLSFILAVVVSMTMLSVSVFAGGSDAVVKDVTEGRASTYTAAYYVPGSSGAADYVTWSATGSQNEGGEHIQTAVLKSDASNVPAGQNAINVGGGLGNVKLKNNDDYGAKTLHCRYTFVESTSPILMRFQYQNSSNGGSPKDTFTMSNSGVTFDGKTVAATAPYDINIFQNVETGVTVIYVNDEILYDARTTGNNLWGSGSHHWQQFRFRTTEDDSAFKLVIKNMHHEVYSEKFLISDVIDYVMLDDKSVAQETNYLWSIDGIKTDWAKIQGAMDGICSITGNNTDGYVLTPNSISESHYGYARFFLGHGDKVALAKSTDDKILHQSFEYNPTNLTTGQIFEIRGNNAYQTLMTANPATETNNAYLAIGSKKICEINENDFYKIDFIVNNKDYEYYIVVDGNVAYHGAIWNTRQPLWQTVFSSYTLGESMTLKNMKTTVYDSTVSIFDIVSEVATTVYVEATDAVYDSETKLLQMTATMVGSETAFETADLIYAAYDANGALISVSFAETDTSNMNTNELGRTYPYGELNLSNVAEGESITVKVFLWNSASGVKPISNADTYSYTVPATEV